MSYLESEALCPYFDSDALGIIKCEIGDLKILDNQMKRDVGYALCASKYEECPFKIALDGYYKRVEEKEKENRITCAKSKNKIRLYDDYACDEPAPAQECDGKQLKWF